MSAIGPGDWVQVECPDDDDHGVVGCVVQMLDDGLSCVRCGSTVGFDIGDGLGLSWCACELRPLGGGLSHIETLKQPAPDAVRKLEDA